MYIYTYIYTHMQVCVQQTFLRNFFVVLARLHSFLFCFLLTARQAGFLQLLCRTLFFVEFTFFVRIFFLFTSSWCARVFRSLSLHILINSRVNRWSRCHLFAVYHFTFFRVRVGVRVIELGLGLLYLEHPQACTRISCGGSWLFLTCDAKWFVVPPGFFFHETEEFLDRFGRRFR